MLASLARIFYTIEKVPKVSIGRMAYLWGPVPKWPLGMVLAHWESIIELEHLSEKCLSNSPASFIKLKNLHKSVLAERLTCVEQLYTKMASYNGPSSLGKHN